MAALEGRVALITGAARGMGATHARRFVAEGARIVLTDILEEGAAVAAELGENALWLHHDVRRKAEWRHVVEIAEERFGPIDVLVNNAAIALGWKGEGPIEELDEEVYRRHVDINQIGTFLGIKAVVPSMRRAGRGSIVNISSIAGLTGAPNAIAYVATKFAVRGMTKAAAVELGKYNIRVNSVHPGVIRTPMHVAGRDDVSAAEVVAVLDKLVASLLMTRWAEPEEVTNLVLYLASDQSSFSTGAEFIVDGGFSAQ